MVISRPPHYRLLIIFASAALFGLVLLSACRSSPAPTATANTTVIPASAPATRISVATTSPQLRARALPSKLQATSTPTTVGYRALSGTITLSSFAIPLPTDWQYLLLTETTYRDELASLAAANPTLSSMVENLYQGQEVAPTIVVAWPIEPTLNAGFVGYVIPRRDLTMYRYQRAIADNLSGDTAIAILENRIDYDLRDDVPIGYLQYRQEAGEHRKIHGAHYWLLSKDTSEWLLLTCVIETDHPALPAVDKLFHLLEQIVTTIEPHSASTD